MVGHYGLLYRLRCCRLEKVNEEITGLPRITEPERDQRKITFVGKIIVIGNEWKQPKFKNLSHIRRGISQK